MAQDQEREPPEWDNLLPEMLCEIYKKLYDTFDAIRFRAVCKSWRNSAPLTEHPPQLPFLLSDDFRLYSLHTGRMGRLHVPEEAQGRMFCGQSNGFLVIYGCRSFPDLRKPFTSIDVTLLNPFTRAKKKLNNLGGFSFYSPVFIGKNAIENDEDDVLIHMSGLVNGHCLGFQDNANGWHCTQIFRDDAITLYKGRPVISRSYNYGGGGPIGAVKFFCLVEAAGSLLGILRLEECSFWVYQLEEETGHPRWVLLNDIGDQMIFLNRNQGFCLSASNFDGIRGNCIYFTSRNGTGENVGRTLILRYDLGTRSVQLLDTSTQLGATWIVPNVY